ncbi:hypothetical protein PTKIN_Ptkin01aG0243300 [Pterospermum kingtungense]
MDALLVVAAITSSVENISEFGAIISSCKKVLDLEQNYSVCIVRRQTNEVAHALAREARLQACSFYL